MTQNLFIIGPVASGKNTLLNNLKKKYNMSVLDTGQLYRYLALCLLNETTINPDCEKLCKNDAEEENRISKAIFRWSRTIEKALDELEVIDGKLCLHGKILLEESLYSKEVNEIVSVVAKSNMVRNRILQFINVDIAKRKKNYALTGHNITELDTTKFTTVFLDISNEKAAQRLYGRNSMAYESVLSAYNEVLDRNNRDGMEQTKILMKDVYNMIYVDTTELSEEQVTSIVIDEIEKIESKKQKFEELQATSSIERQNFKWMFNPFLEVIKAYLERNIDRYLVNKEYISRTDLEYQVLIKMCSYNIEKVFKGDSSLLREMDNGIKSREDNLNEFVDCLIEKKVNLNYELVNNEIKNQIERLDVLYNDDFIKKVMSKLNSSENKKNMSLKNITYKKVDKEVSKFIAKNCHY